MIFALLCFKIPFLNRQKVVAKNAAVTRDELKRKYQDHTAYSYSDARTHLYNSVDCRNNELYLVYGGNTYSWTCGGSSKPSSSEVNCEHTVPQSFFDSKTPMVSDIHHLFSSPSKLNSARSNHKFGEFSYDSCKKYCKDFECTTSKPSNPEQYSCLSNDSVWMPRKEDRGRIARAVLYFYTMYTDYDISAVGSLSTFKSWNNQFPPDSFDTHRNDAINKTQGNRNPYIDDYTLVDQVW